MRFFRSLLLSAVLTSTLQAGGFSPRSLPQISAQVTESISRDGSARVLIVAKEARNLPTDIASNAVQRRQMAGALSTQAIRDLLDSEMGLVESHAELLWACNTVVSYLTPEALERLRQEPTVKEILLDREIQVLLEGEPEAGEIPTNYGVAKIRASQARETKGLTGAGIRVGVIDTGVDGNHPALAGKVVAFKDFVQDKKVAYDDQGHGTHCAGTIAGEGGIGIAPQAEIVAAKALNKRGGGTLSGLLKAMQWMLDPDGDSSTQDQPRLVSNSWGADAKRMGSSRNLFRDIVKAWREAGIVPVFASGNSGLGSQAVPGGQPEAFAVGATDSRDRVARFSTGGPIDWDGETFLKPDVSAPGVSIISAVPGGKYKANNGTSMACPHVAGAMALVFEAFPQTSVDGMIQAFVDGSVDLGAEGRDDRFGEGRVDVMATLEALSSKQALD